MSQINVYRLKTIGLAYERMRSDVMPDYADILVEFGLDEADLNAPGARAPILAEAGVVERVTDILGDKTFPAKVGLAARRAGTLTAYLVRAARNVREAVTLMQRYYALEDLDTQVEVTEAYERPLLTLRSRSLPTHKTLRHREFLTFGLMTRVIQAAGDEIRDLCVTLAHDDHDHARALSELAGVTVMAGEADFAVCLPKGGLDIEISTRDEVLRDHLQKHGDDLLRTSSAVNDGIVGRVLALLRDMMPGHTPDGDEVANAMGMTRRTLTRQLGSNGAKFKDLLDQVRCEKAQDLLRQEQSIAQVAFILDYADQSSFSVAFKRWTGSTPGEYKREA